MTGQQLDAARVRFREQRVKNVAGAVRIREQLAVGLFVQRDAELAKESDRLADGEGAQNLSNDRAAAAPEVPVRDNGVGHVAARSAADENFGAGSPCGVEEGDAQRGCKTAREDGGGQARGAGPDDRHVAGRRDAQSSCQSRASFWKSSTNPWIIDTTGWALTA